MPAAAPPFAPVAQCDEVPSTSCAEGEEARLVREPQGKARGVWKLAVVATVTGLIAAAGTWWSNGGTVKTAGDEVTGLVEVTFETYNQFGCGNWQQLEISRSVVADLSACIKLCEENQDCTHSNFQPERCEPGWPENGGCLLFNGDCDPVINRCWMLTYKIVTPTTVTQTLTVQTSATAADAEAAVAKALADKGITPVTTTSTPGRRLQQHSRRLQNTWIITWLYKTLDSTKGDFAYNYAVAVSSDPAASKAFVNECAKALPEKVTFHVHVWHDTFDVIQFGDPVKESGGTTETPDGGLTTGMPGSA